MFTLNKIVKEGILEVSFLNKDEQTKTYTISNANDVVIMEGKIVGYTQKVCLCVCDLKKGQYSFALGDQHKEEFKIH